MEHTLASAAKTTGISETTVLQDIMSGRLPARHLVDRSYRIDAMELARVYNLQPLPHDKDDTLQTGATRSKDPAAAAAPTVLETELTELRVKVQKLEAQLGQERETVNDLRKQLDEKRAVSLNLQLRPSEQGLEDLQKQSSVESVVDAFSAELASSEESRATSISQPLKEVPQDLPTAAQIMVEPTSSPELTMRTPLSAAMAVPDVAQPTSSPSMLERALARAKEPQPPLLAKPLGAGPTSHPAVRVLKPAGAMKSQELPTAPSASIKPISPSVVRVLRPSPVEHHKRSKIARMRADIPPVESINQELAGARKEPIDRDTFLRRLAATLEEPAKPSGGFLRRFLAR